MSNGILLLGGYGNFGKRIAEQLVDRDVPVIINGRDKVQADALADKLGPKASAACLIRRLPFVIISSTSARLPSSIPAGHFSRPTTP